ncbi:MAG: hypothetical protein NC245_08670 [Muribaculum sp.]|nr:hypothetical protein [Muribaculum sp.]
MPELYNNPDFNWQMFYGACVRTYIEWDVRELSENGDTVKFTRFMVAAAASTGQFLNLASLARDGGISQPTAERWRGRSSRALLSWRSSRAIITRVY